MATLALRPMTADDVAEAAAVAERARQASAEAAGEPVEERSGEDRDRYLAILRRFTELDAPGCWLGESDGGTVGMAVAIRRAHFWGLSLLFVDPAHQGGGVGRALLDRAMGYAEGATEGMIVASEDPRALRRYALAGFELHPAVYAQGRVDRAGLPAASTTGVRVRTGAGGDLDLVDDVDRRLSGRSRRTDAEFLLGLGARLVVAADGRRRGYAVQWRGRGAMLAADSVEVATALLWDMLASTGDDDEFAVYTLTAEQRWTVGPLLAVRLPLRPGGPLFVRGRAAPPAAWLPSGVFF